MKRYYKITFSSKINDIKDNIINSSGSSASVCSNIAIGVTIPTTISSISETAFYECENLQTITVGKQTFNRPEGYNEIPIRLNGQTITEKIKEKVECTVFPFELKTPLCPEDKE
jgi:hypothetical protein